jgi:hypothetical protein
LAIFTFPFQPRLPPPQSRFPPWPWQHFPTNLGLKDKPPRNDREVLGVVAILGGVIVASASIAHER